METRRRSAHRRAGATRVLHVSVVHRPDDPRIHERECRTLSRPATRWPTWHPGLRRLRRERRAASPLPERSRRTRLLSGVEIVKALRLCRPQVLHVHDPELLPLFPALRALVPRLVYDMHEYVPEAVAGKPYIPAPIRPLAAPATVAQRGLAALADGVVVVADEQLAALGSAPRLRATLPNYPCLERFDHAVPGPDLAADPASSSSTSAASRGREAAP